MNQDKLILKDAIREYRVGAMTLNGERGAGIFYKEDPGDDLVAFLKGVTNLTALKSKL